MAVRKVRTEAGRKRYGQPIGSIIIKDSVLRSLKVTGAPFKGWTRVKGTNGKEYDIGHDDDANVWVALEPDTWDVVADEGDTEEEIFELLDAAVRKRGSNPTPENPVLGTAVNKPAAAVKPEPKKPAKKATAKKSVAKKPKMPATKKPPAGKPIKDMTAPEKRAEAGRIAREGRAAAKKSTTAKKTTAKKNSTAKTTARKNPEDLTETELTREKLRTYDRMFGSTDSARRARERHVAINKEIEKRKSSGAKQGAKYTVVDPNGNEHTRSSSKPMTHAVVRRNKGSDRYFVNFASSEENANREANVQTDLRDYVQIVPLKDGEKATAPAVETEPVSRAKPYKSSMKVSESDYNAIAKAIAKYDTDEMREKYRQRQFPRAAAVKDLDKRYRWDLYYHAGSMEGGMPDSTNGYNTDTLDTALRNIVPPLGTSTSPPPNNKPTTAEMREVNKLPERSISTYKERRKIGATHDEAMGAARRQQELDQGEPQYGTDDSDWGTPAPAPKPPKKATQARRPGDKRKPEQRMQDALSQAQQPRIGTAADHPPTFDEQTEQIAQLNERLKNAREMYGSSMSSWTKRQIDDYTKIVQQIGELRKQRGPGDKNPTREQRREINTLSRMDNDLYWELRDKHNYSHDEAFANVQEFGEGAKARRREQRAEQQAREQDAERGYQRNEYSEWSTERLHRMLKATNLKPTARRKMEAEMRRRVDRADRESEIRSLPEDDNETGHEDLSDRTLARSIKLTREAIADNERPISVRLNRTQQERRDNRTEALKADLERLLAEQQKRQEPPEPETGYENLSDVQLTNSIRAQRWQISDLEKNLPARPSKRFLATRRASVKKEKERLKQMMAEQRKRKGQ